MTKTYPTREAAARAWLDTAKRARKAITLGGGWWLLHYTLQSGAPAKIRLQGLRIVAEWLLGRGVLRALPDGSVVIDSGTN